MSPTLVAVLVVLNGLVSVRLCGQGAVCLRSCKQDRALTCEIPGRSAAW